MAWTWTLTLDKIKTHSIRAVAVLTSDASASGSLSFATKLDANQLRDLDGCIPLSVSMVPATGDDVPSGTFDVTVSNSVGTQIAAKTANSASAGSYIDLTENFTDIVQYLTFTSTTLGNANKATFYFKFYRTNIN